MTDYDSPWKQMLTQYFPEFLAFFFPKVHAGIDWTKPYTPLDKELQKVVRDATLGQRRADQLVGVTGLDGGEDRVLVHVEVQGEKTADFSQRMFVYNYRAYDLYGRPVVSLVVMGESHPSDYGKFGYGRWGSWMRLRFPVVSLTAYRARWAELEASANPFAVVTQAHLKAQETTGADEVTRYRAKLGLIRSLYQHGYARQAILDLFRFIDWVLALPDGLEDQLWTEIEQFDEENRMHYMASFERKAQAKGIEKGRAEGQVKFFSFLLQQRFGELPEWVEARLQQADPTNLETWGMRMLSAQRLEEVFAAGDEPAAKPH
ncbi:MAG TPA: cytosolic protein [Gammaproteobacteria bacterium]|nr:cytosolic protein [Gammaproteobacteria bacterium]